MPVIQMIRRFWTKPVPGRAKRYSRSGPKGEWKPPAYAGPTMIGKAITVPPEPTGPDWIGKAIPNHPGH